MTEGDTNSSIIERIEEGDEEILHKIIYKNDKNEIQWIRYCYKDVDGNLHDYGYENSSIKIDFQRDDTKELQPKTYYLEIYHETVNSRGERTKSTLLPPIDFIINGALA